MSDPDRTKKHFIRLLKRYGRVPDSCDTQQTTPLLDFARKLRQQEGEYLFALDVVQTGLACLLPSLPDICNVTDIDRILDMLEEQDKSQFINLKQEEGILLNNLGLYDRAIQIFEGLRQAGKGDAETLGNLASAYKRRGIKHHSAKNSDHQQLDFAQALRVYQTHFEQQPNSYWTGINAVVLCLALGHRHRALSLLARVFKVLEPQHHNSDDIWRIATYAEALLLRYVFNDHAVREDAVIDAYQALGRMARGKTQAHDKKTFNIGVLKSARINLPIILKWALPQAMTTLLDAQRIALSQQIDALIQMPAVIVFTGHLTDEDDRATPRFPATQSTAVKAAIQDFIHQHDAYWGYSSGARGSDLLFLEAMLEQGASIALVLPYGTGNGIKGLRVKH